MSFDIKWDAELKFSAYYSKLLACVHGTLSIAALISVKMAANGDTTAEFGKIWTTPVYLITQSVLCLVVVYWTKYKCGLFPCLPNAVAKTNARQCSGGQQKIDFTKGPLLRRVMQGIKHLKMKLAPLHYVAMGILTLLIFLVMITYVIFCFGAPLNFSPFTYFLQHEPTDFGGTTIAFGLLVTIHTALPIVLVYGGAETIGGEILHVFLNSPMEQSTSDDTLTNAQYFLSHSEPIAEFLYCNAMGALIGAWFGAFPIPLDWDRPWQIWPITCSIGLCIGAGIGNLVSLFKSLKLKHQKNTTSILTSIKTKKA